MVSKYIAPLFAAGLVVAGCAGVPDKGVTGNVASCQEQTGAHNIGYRIGQGLRSLFDIGAGVAYTAVTKDLSGVIQAVGHDSVSKEQNICNKLSN